jgi:hypothetical protein
MATTQPFDWNKPPTDKDGNIIKDDDPDRIKKLLEADYIRMVKSPEAARLKEAVANWQQKRSSTDINERVGAFHTPQQKAAVILEALDSSATLADAPEIQAAVKGLQRIKETPMSKKPEPIAYEIYQSLRELAQEVKKEDSTGFYAERVNSFTSALIQGDLIRTEPQRGTQR